MGPQVKLKSHNKKWSAVFINKRSDKNKIIQHNTLQKHLVQRLYMNPEYDNNLPTSLPRYYTEEEEEEYAQDALEAARQREGESGYTVETTPLPDVHPNLLPYLSQLPDHPRRCFNSSVGTGGTNGVYSSQGTPRVGRATLTRVYPSSGEKGDRQPSILRSATEGLNRDLSRELPQLPHPEVGPEILHEGQQLREQHGSNRGIERDLEAGEGPSKRRKGPRSDSPTRDEGIELFREYISQVNAEHDCWIQANPWYSEQLNVFQLYP